jgi:hypothetical protein
LQSHDTNLGPGAPQRVVGHNDESHTSLHCGLHHGLRAAGVRLVVAEEVERLLDGAVKLGRPIDRTDVVVA